MSWVWSYEDFVKWKANVQTETRSDVIDQISILDQLVLYAREMNHIEEVVEKVKKNEICPACKAAVFLAEEIATMQGWSSKSRHEYQRAKHTDDCVFRDGVSDA